MRLLEAGQRLLGGERPSIVTIDMSVATVPISARRAAETAISRQFGGRLCSAHSPDSVRPGEIGDNLTQDFATAGYGVATLETPCGHLNRLVEVYPHPALLTLLGVPTRFPYKVDKSGTYWRGTSVSHRIGKLLDGFHRIRAALQLHLTGINLPLPNNSQTLAGLKRYEDGLDALVCAWIGMLYLGGRARSVGDDTAAIWLPREAPPNREAQPPVTKTQSPTDYATTAEQSAATTQIPFGAQPAANHQRNDGQPDDTAECLCCEFNIPTTGPRICPLCEHEFQGNGWDGINAHWRSRHEGETPYTEFWNSLCKQHKSHGHRR